MKPLVLIPLAFCAAAFGYLLGTPGAEPDVAGTSTKAAGAKSDVASGAGTSENEDVSRALLAFVAPTRLEDFAEMNSLLARLTPADFPRLIAAIERMSGPGQDGKMLTVFRAWIGCDPDAAHVWGRRIARQCAVEGFSAMGGSVMRAIAEEWCARFRDDALALARECWPASGSGSVLHNFIWSCPKDGFPGCLAAVQSFPPGRGRKEAIVSFFCNWGQMDRERAFDAAKRMEPGLERDSALAQVIVLDGQRNPRKAFARALEFGITDPRFLGALGQEAGVQKGAEISKWLDENGPDLLAAAGPALASQWASRDPKAALSWALARGLSITEGGGGRAAKPWDEMTWNANMGDFWPSPFEQAMRTDSAATAEWLRSLPAGEDRDALIQRAIAQSSGGSESLALFAQLPPERQAAVAASVVVGAFQNQSAKAREWASTLPVGPVQDAAWRGLARVADIPEDFPEGRIRDLMLDVRSLNADPEHALPLIAKITDLASRRRSFENAMWGALHERDPSTAAKARELLETCDFPPAWKTALRAGLTQ